MNWPGLLLLIPPLALVAVGIAWRVFFRWLVKRERARTEGRGFAVERKREG